MSAEGRVEHQKLVDFLVFNSIGQLISLPSDEVYRVGVNHAVVLEMGMLLIFPGYHM